MAGRRKGTETAVVANQLSASNRGEASLRWVQSSACRATFAQRKTSRGERDGRQRLQSWRKGIDYGISGCACHTHNDRSLRTDHRSVLAENLASSVSTTPMLASLFAPEGRRGVEPIAHLR